MIWEVDDDCDKAVNWPEFQAMYNRCRNDKTGVICFAVSVGKPEACSWKLNFERNVMGTCAEQDTSPDDYSMSLSS